MEKMSTQLLLDKQDKLASVKLLPIFRNICLPMHFPFFSKFRPANLNHLFTELLVIFWFLNMMWRHEILG